MKSMFINYDNNIEKKVTPPHLNINKKLDILDSEDTVSIAKDVFGNEIGVKVKHNIPFNLYFYLDGWIGEFSIDALVACSQLNIKVISFRHKIILEKILDTADLYDDEADCLVCPFTADEAKTLDIDTYKISATLIWDGGSYELFSENDGLLIIR